MQDSPDFCVSGWRVSMADQGRRREEEETVAHAASLGWHFHRCELGEVPRSEVFWVYTIGGGVPLEVEQVKGTLWEGWNREEGGVWVALWGAWWGVSELEISEEHQCLEVSVAPRLVLSMASRFGAQFHRVCRGGQPRWQKLLIWTMFKATGCLKSWVWHQKAFELTGLGLMCRNRQPRSQCSGAIFGSIVEHGLQGVVLISALVLGLDVA